MSILSRLSDPSHWINRSAFVLTLFTLEILTLGSLAIVAPQWLWDIVPSISSLMTIIIWSLLYGILLLDERRQHGGLVLATGIIPTRQTPRMILRGVLWAFFLLGPIALVGVLLGGEFSATSLTLTPLVLLSIIVSSIGEELLFRSTLLRVLQERFGSSRAILITSVLFSLAHSGNPSASVMSSINTFLIAIAFGTVIALGGAIWVAAACHAAWNIIVALLFGTVSGLDAGLTWIHYMPSASSTLSPLLMGDGYGVESGLLCTAVITISLAFIRHIVVIDPFVVAARHRIAFNRGPLAAETNNSMESSNEA